MTRTETGPVKPDAGAAFTDRSDRPESTPARTVDIDLLIRSLQRVDGLDPCFRSGQTHCDNHRCPWRQYCLDA